MNTTKEAFNQLRPAYKALKSNLDGIRSSIGESKQILAEHKIKNNKEVENKIYKVLKLAKKTNDQLHELGKEIDKLNIDMEGIATPSRSAITLDE